MSAESIARSDAMLDDMRLELDLAELRRAQALSQAQIAEQLNIGQAAVAKIEKRADMYVSTMRRFVEAMGGELEMTARFADRVVVIRNLADLSASGLGGVAAAVVSGPGSVRRRAAGTYTKVAHVTAEGARVFVSAAPKGSLRKPIAQAVKDVTGRYVVGMDDAVPAQPSAKSKGPSKAVKKAAEPVRGV
jgi:hypothetical protein